MIKEIKQKIQGPTESKYICATIQITSQNEFLIFFSALKNFNTHIFQLFSNFYMAAIK